MEIVDIINKLPYIAVALLGQVVHILAKLAKLEKRKGFNLGIWFSKNGFSTALGFIAAITGVFVLGEDINYTTAITGGYVVDSILKNGQSSLIKKNAA